jgi:ribosomal protein L11 methyltransferase
VIRLAIRVAGERSEEVLAELLELAPAGVEEVAGTDGTVEYAVYGAPGELPGLPDLSAIAGGGLVEISTSEVADDWQERWKQFHHPVLVEAPAGSALPSLRVRPPWEPGVPEGAGVSEIVIDPGQAFGTGGHGSTRLCLSLLLELASSDQRRGPVLDIGTGSGVLAIAAASLGYAPVLGLDHEAESVVAARENATVNGQSIQVRRLDLRTEPMPWLGGETAPEGPLLVLANLLRPLLTSLAESISGPPEHLIASGLLVAEVDEIALAFGERHRLRERLRLQSGEWAALWMSAGA